MAQFARIDRTAGLWSLKMFWLAQQRYVAWHVAGIFPAFFLSSAITADTYPTTQPAIITPASQDPIDGLKDLIGPDENTVDLASPAVHLPASPATPEPQPINNPLPPAFWSALSVFGLLGLFLMLRRLKAQLR
jgi:hypothetical protein